jgi:hypothetical protein
LHIVNIRRKTNNKYSEPGENYLKRGPALVKIVTDPWEGDPDVCPNADLVSAGVRFVVTTGRGLLMIETQILPGSLNV